MADSENYLELQRLEEESEMVMKKLKDANNKLKSIQKQCNESQILICELRSEMEVLQAKEETLNEDIPLKTKKVEIIQTDCEQVAKQLGNVLWKRKIIAARRELEINNRRRHEKIMKGSIEPACFVQSGGHENRLQKTDDLKNKLGVLKKEITKKHKLNDEYEKSYLEAQKSNKTRTKAILEIKNNIESMEILIDQQNEELQRLSNNTATNSD